MESIEMVKETIYNLCPIYFHGSSIIYENDTFKIYSSDDNFCTSFFIGKDNFNNVYMEIVKLKRCIFSGTTVLEGLNEIIKHGDINHIIKFITLDDESTINWCNIVVDFALLNIMVKGKSWYNSLGYYQENYNNDIVVWEEFLNSKFNDFLEYMYNPIPFDVYENVKSSYYDNGLEYYALNILMLDLDGENFDFVLESAINYIRNGWSHVFNGYDINIITSSEVCQIINYYIKNNVCSNISIYYYLILGLYSLVISYDRDNLKKIL